MKLKRIRSSLELIDFWSIPHFLFGSVTALLASAYALPAGTMFLTTLFLAILWELFEYRNHIVESFRNRVTDVLYPLIAFPVTYLYAQNIATDQHRRISLLAIVSIIFFYINYMAWKARFADDKDFMN
ncbi:MAG: hypothetical protein HGB37_05050 [Candidatus Moranbacteria bacterium]|nr:hypothetical protein [Candidatus Moranbacteria bacterium]